MSPIKETIGALGAGVAIAVVVACGGGAYKSSTKPPTSAGPDAMPGLAGAGDPKSQIEALDGQINTEFAKLGMERPLPPPSPAADLCANPPCPKADMLAVKPSDDPKCVKGTSQTCTDTCSIADSICDAAIKICRISSSMGNDAWAIEKCSSGEASCETARGKCCGCL